MKTTANTTGHTLHAFAQQILTARLVRGFVTASAALLAILGSMPHSSAQQTVYSVNIVGCRDIADRTTYLLTTPMTARERQALHAHNFYALLPGARAVYLHAVAYAAGYSVASGGAVPSPEMLVNHMSDVIMTGFVDDAPEVPQQLSGSLAEFVPAVHTVMSQLNALISDELTNKVSYQDAMYSGAIFGLTAADGQGFF